MENNLIISEFGSLMEKLHGKGTEPRLYYPESLLPHPKNEIYTAMISELLKLIPDKSLKTAEMFFYGLDYLQTFLPDKLAEIGNTRLNESLKKFRDENHEEYNELIS